jgi:uncharacterized cupin superfamily protein
VSLIKLIETANLGDGVVSKAKPEMLLAGDPTFTAWNQVESRNGTILSGVWQGTPGTTRSIKGERFEFCLLLEGVIELTEDGGETVTYRAGDAFVMKPGFVGVWKTLETVRKIYVVVD